MKPIKSATIYFRNDPSVGIHSATFQMELHLDPSNFFDDSAAILNETRTKIADLYEYLEGDKPTWVRFDFEIEAENRADDERFDSGGRCVDRSEFSCPCGEDH